MENLQEKSVNETTYQASGGIAILDALLNEKVETVFGYPGGAIMPLYDELYSFRDRINHILVRHEQGAIHAAQGYARASGKTGVVFATSGPGATNLVTGLADAMIDSTPLVCITGQVFAHLLGTDAFQETDIVGITSPITKWNYQITDAREIPEVLAKAFFIAKSGRPGPVLIDITKNAQLQNFEYNGYQPCIFIRSYKPIPDVNQQDIEKAAELINQAKKPLVVFGQGVILGNAEQELKNFVEKAQIPASWTILGMSALPTDHSLAVGMVGMHGNYAPNVLTNECDVLIAIGMRFDDRVTGRLDKYAKQAKIIHFDIDPAEINKNVPVDISICGDCKETLPKVTELLQRKNNDAWLDEFKKLQEKENQLLIDDELSPVDNELTMGEVIRIINEITDGDAVIVTDVGQHQMVACRYSKQKNTRSNITSGGLGTMGFALPAAIGAAFATPEKTIIAIMGDGGTQMNIQELGTIMQSKPNVKIVILNNCWLGMVRQWQELFHKGRYSFTDIDSPDFVKIAEAYKIPGKSISNRENLQSAIKEMILHDGSYLLEVMVKKEGNVFPMVPQGRSVSEVVLTKEEL